MTSRPAGPHSTLTAPPGEPLPERIDKLAPPDIYEDVAEFIQNALENGYREILDWSNAQLAEDLYLCASVGDDTTIETLVECVRIWRERNG